MKFSTNTIIAIIAVAALGAFTYQHLRRPLRPVPASAANCAPEAIRAVADPTERAILYGQCETRKAAGKTAP